MRNKYKYRFLDTWKSVKDVFVKPKLAWYFGPWISEGNLPVWRHGNTIQLAKYGEYESEYDWARLIKCEWTELGRKNHPILSRLFKPIYQLPLWCSFYFFNNDLMYKTKWTEDDYRYEFPPHITLVLFGYAISVTAYYPNTEKEFFLNDAYWESMLIYRHYNDLAKANDRIGYYSPDKSDTSVKFIFRPQFLKKKEDIEYLEKIQKEQSEIILNDLRNPKPIGYGIYTVLQELDNNDDCAKCITEYDSKILIYETEEAAKDALSNLKSIKIKKSGKQIKVSYEIEPLFGYNYLEYNRYSLYKSSIKDKNKDMFNCLI